jgi:hypothetical protein
MLTLSMTGQQQTYRCPLARLLDPPDGRGRHITFPPRPALRLTLRLTLPRLPLYSIVIGLHAPHLQCGANVVPAHE